MGLNMSKILDRLHLGIILVSGALYISVYFGHLSTLGAKNFKYPLPRPVSGVITAIVSPVSKKAAISFKLWLKPTPIEAKKAISNPGG